MTTEADGVRKAMDALKGCNHLSDMHEILQDLIDDLEAKSFVPSTETVLECFLDGADGNFIEEDFYAWLNTQRGVQ